MASMPLIISLRSCVSKRDMRLRGSSGTVAPGCTAGSATLLARRRDELSWFCASVVASARWLRNVPGSSLRVDTYSGR
eukprot:219109-Prymnesium_polylepis.1